MLTTGGIIMGITMSILIGGFFGIALWCNWETHFIKKLITQIVMCGLIFLFVAIGYSGQDKNWNNGYCIECGTKYECVGKSRSTSEYFYSCPNCFHKAVR